MQGLKDKQMKRISELLIMANEQQLWFIRDSINKELQKRFNIALSPK